MILGLLLALQLGIIPGGLWVPYGVPGTEISFAASKASALPTGLPLWPLCSLLCNLNLMKSEGIDYYKDEAL